MSQKPCDIDLKKLLHNKNYPLSNKYDPQWILDNEMGPNALWLTEWLCRDMDLTPGMRVLDMGCGRCLSSVFLAREFGVEVWATDLWIKASDNFQRICEAGLEDKIIPIHAEAHSLPYAEGFFDAIVCVDSYVYYGTADMYLNYFHKFVAPGGQIGLVVPGLVREFADGKVPDYLTQPIPSGKRFWDPAECFCFHSPQWWQRHLGQTELLDDLEVNLVPQGWQDWLDLERVKAAAGMKRFEQELPALEADQGRYLGIIQITARRK